MKEEGDWSSKSRLPHSSTTSEDRCTTPEWDSLPPELVRHIANCVLSTTGGVDAYMDMRAVCPSWRSAIAKPPPHAAFADHRFRPRNWIMVDLKSRNPDARLFLHVPTGRFRRLRLPLLSDYLVLGASDGLILLRDRERPHLTGVCVLNPLTGDMLHFAAPSWEDSGHSGDRRIAVSGGPQPTLIVWRDVEWRWHMVVYADPTSAEFTEEDLYQNCEEDIGTNHLTSMVTFQGDIYLAGIEGLVLKFVRPAEHCDHQVVLTARIWPDLDVFSEEYNPAGYYLVESAGELLLVRHWDGHLKVFRVDVKRKLLEEVKSLGCRALFLGHERCLSVDADKLLSVHSDCIYMIIWVEEYTRRFMHRYNLRDGLMEAIEPFLLDPSDYSCRDDTSTKNLHLHPISLTQVLLDYCDDVTQI